MWGQQKVVYTIGMKHQGFHEYLPVVVMSLDNSPNQTTSLFSYNCARRPRHPRRRATPIRGNHTNLKIEIGSPKGWILPIVLIRYLLVVLEHCSVEFFSL